MGKDVGRICRLRLCLGRLFRSPAFLLLSWLSSRRSFAGRWLWMFRRTPSRTFRGWFLPSILFLLLQRRIGDQYRTEEVTGWRCAHLWRTTPLSRHAGCRRLCGRRRGARLLVLAAFGTTAAAFHWSSRGAYREKIRTILAISMHVPNALSPGRNGNACRGKCSRKERTVLTGLSVICSMIRVSQLVNGLLVRALVLYVLRRRRHCRTGTRWGRFERGRGRLRDWLEKEKRKLGKVEMSALMKPILGRI